MAFHKEQYDMSAANDEISTTVNSSKDVLNRHSHEDSKTPSAASEVQRCRFGTVTFGLVALVQLGLITFLALRIQASQKNLTKVKEQLIKTIYNTEANYTNVREKRDDLKRALNDFSFQLNSLTEERDKLKMINYEMETRSKNLTEERDELQGKLNDLVSKQNSLTKERDNLTRINSDTEARSRIISLERDKLRKRLNTLAQPGWTLFRGSAYYISSTTKTWQESRIYCLSADADLMIINSKEEQDFANSFQIYMWIGLTDLRTEGTWEWVDGSPMTTSYWGTTEPNGKTEENCGDIKTFTTERSWNDENCSRSLKWICEMKLTQ
ncbi:hypothetical protein AMECASPLE_022864 [Ameca splendens]|uniref:C-type lectin domain-containing protein n=1 Tax=Ameca splendens TaxID=208324 RepID=A0ABV0Z2V8_9TELE